MVSIEPARRHIRVIHVESIGSTNEEGLALARSGERGPLWLRADVQTNGRGRRGRSWSSPKGNLHASLLLQEPSEIRLLPQLAHVAGIALVNAVTRVTGLDGVFALKWPNDLLHGRSKIAGILVEGTSGPDRSVACVVGLGVNCAHHPDNLPYASDDLSRICGRTVPVDDLFGALASAMDAALCLWDRGRGYPAIREEWMRCAVPIGTVVTVLTGATSLHGSFEGIDAQGRLLVDGPAGLTTIEAGDVVLNDGSAAMVG